MNKIIFYLLLFVSFSNQSLGYEKSDLNEKLCTHILSTTYQDQTQYRCSFCHINAASLINKIQKNIPDFSIDQLNVLVFTTLDPSLFAFKTHSGPMSWGYHVVLEYKNKVMDLDFSKEFGFIPIADYLKEMFVSQDPGFERLLAQLSHIQSDGQSSLSNLKTRIIPANFYLKLIEKTDSFKKSGFDTFMNTNEFGFREGFATHLFNLDKKVLNKHENSFIPGDFIEIDNLLKNANPLSIKLTDLSWHYDGYEYIYSKRYRKTTIILDENYTGQDPNRLLFYRKIYLEKQKNEELNQFLQN